MSMPHSREAEEGVICSFMIDPRVVGASCAEVNLQSSHFAVPHFAMMYAVLMEMWAENTPIDFITMGERIKQRGGLEECGGHGGIAEMFTKLPTAANVSQYVGTVLSKAQVRQGLILAMEYATKFKSPEADAETVIQEFCQRASELPINSVRTVQNMKQLVMGAVSRIETAIEHRGAIPGVYTLGFKGLDTALGGGIRGGDTLLVSAPTKGGKSIFAHNIAEHVTLNHKKAAVVISLEMPASNVTERMIASVGKVDFTAMRNGWVKEWDMEKLISAAKKLADARMVIRDDLFALPQVIAGIRQAKAKYPDLALAVVDYAQLIDVPMRKSDTREMAVAEISTTLRRLSVELDIAMLVLSQENDDGRARESRRLEQDCTAWIQLCPAKDQEHPHIAKVRLNRNGPCCESRLTFLGKYLRFENHHDEQ